jgi:hypothetical protein
MGPVSKNRTNKRKLSTPISPLHPNLENKTFLQAGHCESRQKREKVRGNLSEKDGIALLRPEHHAMPRTVLVQGDAGLRSQ